MSFGTEDSCAATEAATEFSSGASTVDMRNSSADSWIWHKTSQTEQDHEQEDHQQHHQQHQQRQYSSSQPPPSPEELTLEEAVIARGEKNPSPRLASRQRVPQLTRPPLQSSLLARPGERSRAPPDDELTHVSPQNEEEEEEEEEEE
ncbi:unnamed protein product, partial [Laminaria digitata]